MRKLASVQKITDLQPIEGRDRIELASVLGWRVIVKKGEFQVGDLCVYVEIDSVMPETEQFEFLRSKKFRIRTMKMAGVISQGICFPLSVLPGGLYEEGDDVTKVLGVTQYEPEMDDPVKSEAEPKKKSWLMRFSWYRKLKRMKDGSSAFPSQISKTDENRIQTCPWLLENKSPFVLTEKVDGSSGSYLLVRHKGLFCSKYEFIVCSRNRRLPVKDTSIYWQVAEKYDLEAKLRNMIGENEWIAIQGECVGPKVQGNKYKLASPRFYAFNLITPDGRCGSLKARGILSVFDIDFVPIVKEKAVLPDTVEEMLALAHGQTMVPPDGEIQPRGLREGLVARSQDGKISFKAVDPEFLLKYGG